MPYMEPSVKGWIKGLGMPVVEVKDWLEIEKGIFISGEIFGTWNGNFLGKQFVVLREELRLSVLTGCAHPGLFPVLQRTRNRFTDPIPLLMGGFHLMNSSEEEISAAKKEEETVCECFGVTDLEIQKAVKENGLTSVEEVTNYTKAGGGCGNCHARIEGIIQWLSREIREPRGPRLISIEKMAVMNKNSERIADDHQRGNLKD